jgi:hypothetical protein
MLKFFIALMTGVWIANPAMADRLPVGEIQPTPEMLAKARRVIPPQGADDRIIYIIFAVLEKLY